VRKSISNREVALIYSAYVEALDRFGLTDETRNQLRALQIERRSCRAQRFPALAGAGRSFCAGWFFLISLGAGEILAPPDSGHSQYHRHLNHDERNEESFSRFGQTIEHLESIAAFRHED